MLPSFPPAILQEIAPHFTSAKAQQQTFIIDGCSQFFSQACQMAKLNTHLRLAHFLAQIAHESDGFSTTEEYASGQSYEGRQDLGNNQSGDGCRFKGRGLIQLTGRHNYTKFDNWVHKNTDLEESLIKKPSYLALFPFALYSASWFWQSHKLNNLADKDDLKTLTQHINGGLNGYQLRLKYLDKAKLALQKYAFSLDAFFLASIPLIQRGEHGLHVISLQNFLTQTGDFNSKIDGIYGAKTEKAVRSFQRNNNLAIDGIAGHEVLKTLSQKLGVKNG